jgi:acetyl-CoA synthetase
LHETKKRYVFGVDFAMSISGGTSGLNGGLIRKYTKVFKWQLPRTYNIGVDVCDKWAGDRRRVALIHVGEDDVEQIVTFHALKEWSNRLANTLQANGIARGDRIGILLPQCPETLITHIAAYKLGAVALPLLTLFRSMALEYRLTDSGATCVITDAANLPNLMEIRDRLPQLKLILAVGATPRENVFNFWESLALANDGFNPVKTVPDDPALIIYTSGTTGQPKGTLHGHRLLLGILPGFEFFHNLFPGQKDLLYTPLDWAYIGGSYDALFPSLHHGVPVLAFRPRKFDPEKSLYMMEKYHVRNLMVVPTVLRMMMHAVETPRDRYKIDLRSLTAGGETLGEELHAWCRDGFNVQLNEQYGQTECDLVVGFCSQVMPIIPGTIGKAVPGHVVEILDEQSEPAAPGTLGEIAVKAPDPVMFLEYWNNPEATQAKFSNGWLRTGDYGVKDEAGCFTFSGRQDDLIESGGYRIGPGEVEACLMAHAAVKHVCVLGVPDDVRGEVVKAFIVPVEGTPADMRLEESLRDHVKGKLEKHAYPRKIEFLKEMPMTKTGKIRKELLKFSGIKK